MIRQDSDFISLWVTSFRARHQLTAAASSNQHDRVYLADEQARGHCPSTQGARS